MADLAGKKTAYFSFSGMIDPNGTTRIASALNHAVNEKFDEVYLCFNSPGGYVGDGVFLYNTIRGLPIKVIGHNMGSLMSMAVPVFLAMEERYCSKYSMFMMHPTTLGPFAERLTFGRLDDARSGALAEDTRTESILRERASVPDDVLVARKARDVYVSPDQALQWRLVHEVREFTLPKGNQIVQI